MKTQEHTAGPWEILRSKRPPVEICSPDRATTVAHAYRILDNEDEQQANARLIAAAPQLLEALERVWDSRHEPDKWSLEVVKALEAATGVPHNFRTAREEIAHRSAKGETL